MLGEGCLIQQSSEYYSRLQDQSVSSVWGQSFRGKSCIYLSVPLSYIKLNVKRSGFIGVRQYDNSSWK